MSKKSDAPGGNFFEGTRKSLGDKQKSGNDFYKFWGVHFLQENRVTRLTRSEVTNGMPAAPPARASPAFRAAKPQARPHRFNPGHDSLIAFRPRTRGAARRLQKKAAPAWLSPGSREMDSRAARLLKAARAEAA
jgi:hypothetical protein